MSIRIRICDCSGVVFTLFFLRCAVCQVASGFTLVFEYATERTARICIACALFVAVDAVPSVARRVLGNLFSFSNNTALPRVTHACVLRVWLWWPLTQLRVLPSWHAFLFRYRRRSRACCAFSCCVDCPSSHQWIRWYRNLVCFGIT